MSSQSRDQPKRVLDIVDEADGEMALLSIARRAYRRRRLMDAARILPVFGLVMVLFPLLWGAPDTA